MGWSRKISPPWSYEKGHKFHYPPHHFTIIIVTASFHSIPFLVASAYIHNWHQLKFLEVLCLLQSNCSMRPNHGMHQQ